MIATAIRECLLITTTSHCFPLYYCVISALLKYCSVILFEIYMLAICTVRIMRTTASEWAPVNPLMPRPIQASQGPGPYLHAQLAISIQIQIVIWESISNLHLYRNIKDTPRNSPSRDMRNVRWTGDCP